MYCGSWKIDDLLTFDCATHTPSTGAATDADSAPAYRIYEDETSTPLLTGTMSLLDSANTAGFYTEQITLSAANGFEKGKRYTIYITATVGGVAGVTTRNFQMEAEVDANVVSDKTGYGLVDGAITAAKVADGFLTAAKFASGAFDAVWAVTTRLLTGGTNIVLVKGTGVTGFNDPTAAATASAVRTELGTELGRVDVAVSSRLATAGYIAPPSAASNASAVRTELTTELGRVDVAVSSRATPAQVATELATYDGPTYAEMVAALAAADDAVLAAIGGLNNVSTAQVLTQVQSALTAVVADSIPADGARPSIAQGIYLLTQFMLERSVVGTTMTINKPDGTTALLTLTLNDPTTPSAITRAT